jgi:heptosyltransferase-3
MQRYGGEPLGPAPHIVVLGSCKVGNFVVSTPVLRGLRARFDDAVIGFIGSEVTADFERAHPAIDWRISWDDAEDGSSLRLQLALAEQRQRHGGVALAVNLDGFNPFTCSLVPALEPRYVAGGSLTANRRRSLAWGEEPQQRFLADSDWDGPDFLERYQTVFSSQYIAELFCQLAFVAGHVDPTHIELPTAPPPFPVPELLIHCTTARGAKLWPAHAWLLVIQAAERLGWRVGLVGSPPALQQQAYNAGDLEELLLSQTNLIDLRGQTSLIQLAGACAQAQAVISVDAGPLHIAAAVGTPTLALVGNDAAGTGASPIRLWMPRCASVARTISSHSCSACAENRFRNDDCLVEGHPCMAGVTPESVIDWLQEQARVHHD